MAVAGPRRTGDLGRRRTFTSAGLTAVPAAAPHLHAVRAGNDAQRGFTALAIVARTVRPAASALTSAAVPSAAPKNWQIISRTWHLEWQPGPS